MVVAVEAVHQKVALGGVLSWRQQMKMLVEEFQEIQVTKPVRSCQFSQSHMPIKNSQKVNKANYS